MLSGEPVAVSKHKDAKVFAGTINQKEVSASGQRKSARIHCWRRLYTWCRTRKEARHRAAAGGQDSRDIRAYHYQASQCLPSSHGCYWTEPADSPTDCWHLSRWSSSPARVHWDWLPYRHHGRHRQGRRKGHSDKDAESLEIAKKIDTRGTRQDRNGDRRKTGSQQTDMEYAGNDARYWRHYRQCAVGHFL